MNKLLLFTLTTIVLSAKAQTSVYHPFPESNAVWNYHFTVAGVNCQDGYTDKYYSLTISGDTLINSQTYHKLTTPFIQSVATGTCTGPVIGYQGAIRQDIMNKKVFYVPPSNITEQLLYDFNMQVGDSVKGFTESLTYPDIVQSIDSVLVGNSYRKRWNINSMYQIRFIEGIGSTYGLIKYSPCNAIDLPDYSLTCFSQNGVPLYPSETTNCELITGVRNIFSNEIASMIFPNPFHSSATLELNNDFSHVYLIIYNALGEQVRRQKIISRTTIIHRNELQDGIYFYQVTNDKGQIASGKFIVE